MVLLGEKALLNLGKQRSIFTDVCAKTYKKLLICENRYIICRKKYLVLYLHPLNDGASKCL